MNVRGRLYFAYIGLRGSALPACYREFLAADGGGADDVTRAALARLLRHCRDNVPHYAEILRNLPDPEADPAGVLLRMPILTKLTLRERFEALKSRDLERRRWHLNTSGGSTGEPARFVQDDDFDARTGAIALAYSHWIGHEIGEPELRLWGSEREVLQGTVGWRRRAMNALTRTRFLNAFSMTPERMRAFAGVLRRDPPRLVVAYAQALYAFAGFLEREGLDVPPAGAVITSAGTLHDGMRERIARVFRCPVYDRYGSREVGLIAAERPGIAGLWVPPWTTFVEVVDDEGRPVGPGTHGEIVVTSLVNYAMPLVRYRIGDRGVLAPGRVRGGQVLTRILGRSVDAFRRSDGTMIDGEYFTHLLYFRDWVDRFQFVQTAFDKVLLRIVSPLRDRSDVQPELDDIASHVQAALGPGAELRVEWVDAISPSPSGKYRYTVSEVPAP